MAKRVGRNDRQREFAKKMDTLTGSKSRWQVWQDLIWMMAISISNAVDARFREKREKEYLRISSQYSREEMQVIVELFAMIMQLIEDNDGMNCDFLGELFMDLGLGSELGGQFFTPYHICEAMARIIIDKDTLKEAIDKQGYITVCDPTCGAGALLIAASDYLRSPEVGINFQTQCLFCAQDIDYTTGLMCYVQLSLLGCAGIVKIGNTLTDPMIGHPLFGEEKDTCWYTPMFFSEIWAGRRMIHNFKNLLNMGAPTKNDKPAIEAEAIDSAPDSANAEQIPAKTEQPTAKTDQAAAKATPDPVPDAEKVYTVTMDKRQVAGQLSLF